MEPSGIFTIVIMILCGFMFAGIGIWCFKSKEPVGFYTGVKPPKAEELTDAVAWNRKHGIMWTSYGIGTMICWFGFLFSETAGFITLMVILIGGLIGLVLGHQALEKKYKK